MNGYITFRMGARELAAPLDQVREVVRATGVETLVGVRAPVTGLLQLRGDPLPVVDLRTLPDRDDDGDVLVLVGDDDGPLGLAVDQVVEVSDAESLVADNAPRPLGLPNYVLEVLRAADDGRPVFLVHLRALAGVASISPPAPTRA
ncbi:MAG TPA: chemotaxis protein CheW [Candidatus Limnocylindria bacterium]|nr:chemotaxis protein CheW [Candidatus Limnocylindria bacterium]